MNSRCCYSCYILQTVKYDMHTTLMYKTSTCHGKVAYALPITPLTRKQHSKLSTTYGMCNFQLLLGSMMVISIHSTSFWTDLFKKKIPNQPGNGQIIKLTACVLMLHGLSEGNYIVV